MKPSFEPSLSLEPSVGPSRSSLPSISPSEQPTNTKIVKIEFNPLIVTLFGVTRFGANDEATWEDVTERFIVNFFSVGQFGIEGLEVTVDVLRTRILPRPGPVGVEITFSQTVQMLVSSNDNDIGELAYLWLVNQEDKLRYVRRLQRSDNPRLSEVTSVSNVFGAGLPVFVPTASPSRSAEPTETPMPTSLVRINGASLNNISIRLFGINRFVLNNSDDWIRITQSYIQNFVNARLRNYGIYGPLTTTVTILGTSNTGSTVEDLFLDVTYRLNLSFGTTDETEVPKLMQILASDPFCSPTSRIEYARQLRTAPSSLTAVSEVGPVRGTDYNCVSGSDIIPSTVGAGFDVTIPVQRLSLTLFGINDFGGGRDGRETFDAWQSITEGFITRFYSSRPYNLQDLNIDVRNAVVSSRGTNSLVIEYTQDARMRVSSPDLEIGTLAYEWLSSADDRQDYVRALRQNAPPGQGRPGDNPNPLTLVTDVSQVSGVGLREIAPSPAPSRSFAPTELVSVDVSIERLSMRLIGSSTIDANDWRVATRDYIDDFVRENGDDFDVSRFSTDFIQITSAPGPSSDVDVIVSYNQTFSFSTRDESQVPILIQTLSSLPFCNTASREEYVKFYLNPERGPLENVIASDRVVGTLFQCP